MNKKLAISLPEYDRVFRIVHSVSRSIDDRPGASCLFYNTVGALLLERSLGVRARPMVGAAFFYVDNNSATALSFAELQDDGTCNGTQEGFHCWVETENHIVDFTAPVYREYLAKVGSSINIPRKMFQKEKSRMAPSHLDLLKEGDFYVQSNRELTRQSLERALRSPAIADLANICLSWFKRPPKKIQQSLTMINDLGELTKIELTPLSIVGAW